MHRVNTGTLVAAVGAVLLIVSLFLDWYQPGLTAWTTFEVWDLVLAVVGVIVLVVAAADLRLWHRRLPKLNLLALGTIALVIVVSQLLNHPPAAIGRDVEVGAWMGLAAAVLIVVGGLLNDLGVSLSMNIEGGRAPAAPPTAQQPVGAPAGGLADPAPREPAAPASPAPSEPTASTRAMPEGDVPPTAQR